MQSLFRGYDLVSDLGTAVARARAGAAYLDRRVRAGWEKAIDSDALDIASPMNCVLGQLGRQGFFLVCFPGVWRCVEYGFSCGIFEDLTSLVYRWPRLARAYELLAEGWRVVLRERLEAARPVVGPLTTGRPVAGELRVAA